MLKLEDSLMLELPSLGEEICAGSEKSSLKLSKLYSRHNDLGKAEAGRHRFAGSQKNPRIHEKSQSCFVASVD
jgi:hypothetical protein